MQSLKKRYAAKLFANLISLGIGMVIAIFVPRGLGPKAYGDFNFLSTFFLSLIGFFTLSTESGFFVKLSQRPNDLKLIIFYGQFNILAIIGIFLFVTFCQILGFSDSIWIDQNLGYIYMAALSASLVWLVQIMTYVVDAYALTVSSEIMRIVQKIIGLIIILAMFLLNRLNLVNYFLYNYCISVFLILAFFWIIRRTGISVINNWKLTIYQIKDYVQEFYIYSKPLFVVSVFGILATLFERWLLQKYGGSVQQGFYGLSYQIGSICILFTAAMSSLMMREFAIAYKRNAVDEMALMFRRYVPLLYSVAAFLSCFVCVQAEKITSVFGGDQFKNAVIPVTIMALYPIHQTYGQLNSTIFLATGQTKLYSVISLVFFIIGLPLVIILIAPINKLGHNFGATGLAIKMVLIQFIAVNVQLFYHSKFLKLSFIKYFAHQLISVSLLLIAAIISKILIGAVPVLKDNVFGNILSSGVVYSIFVMGILLFFPVIFGLRPDDIKSGINSLRRQLNSKKT